MWSRRRIIATSMVLAAIMTLVIATAQHIGILWAASLVLGICSVVPQIFVPMARLYSRPEHKSQNMGIVLSGLLSGVLGARVLSGYIGDWFDWRTMFYTAAAIMLICLCVTLRTLPQMQPTYKGSFSGLMHSIISIYKQHQLIRLYSLRAAFAFGSMMAVWSCMAVQRGQRGCWHAGIVWHGWRHSGKWHWPTDTTIWHQTHLYCWQSAANCSLGYSLVVWTHLCRTHCHYHFSRCRRTMSPTR